MARHLMALLLVTACSEAEAPPRPPPTPAPTRPAIEAPDEPPPPSASWPSDVEGLRASVDAFTTVEACLASLQAETPTAVAEAVADLAYDGFFDEVCESLAAVKAGDAEACDALGPSTTRAGCRRRLALLHGRPAACPEDRVDEGREPECVAWAARDASLCRAAPVSARGRCEAVLSGDVARCARLRGGDRVRCEAAVRRYADALGEERQRSPAAEEEAVFQLTATEEGHDAVTVERDALDRGVTLSPRACRWAVRLMRPTGELPAPLSPGAFAPTFFLELAVPPGDARPITLPLNASDAVLSLALPRHGGLTSVSGAEGSLQLDAFEPRRGGAITGSFSGTLRRGDATIRIEGRISTFVRDLEPMPARCAESPAGGG